LTLQTRASAYQRYEVELGGVGISSKPSYYPADDPVLPNKPIYATQTAIFRLISAPMRSPRSVRSAPLPFMPGSSESAHPHKLAGKFVHPVSAPGTGKREPPGDVREKVREKMEAWNVGEVALTELWGVDDVAASCNGSKRYLVGCLGGWGDCAAISGGDGFEVKKVRGKGFVVVMKGFEKKVEGKEEEWGHQPEESAARKDGQTGGW
jgi:hypothetical protein